MGAYAVVGVGAVFAGSARAPITAVVILFELTGECSIILPLMLAIVLAAGVGALVSHDTIYTRKLLRRGIDINGSAHATLRRAEVSTVMVDPPDAIDADADADLAAAAAARLAGDEHDLPVLDRDGRFRGVISARAVLDALAAGDPVTVLTLTAGPDPVSVGAPLGEAIDHLDDGVDAVAVVDTEHRLVGWVRRRDVLTGMTRATAAPGA